MFKKASTQSLALGLAALLLGTQPALAADGNTVELIGPGNSVRSFTIDSEHVVQFAGDNAPQTQVRKASSVERKALKSLKDSQTGLPAKGRNNKVSPVLRDAAGRAYGLPGGLIVTFKDEPGKAEARARLQAAGLVPQEQIAPGIWTAESPAGLESIEMANKANASGAFADVSPNWWTRRALK